MANKVNLDILLKVLNETASGFKAAEKDGTVAAKRVESAWQQAVHAAGGGSAGAAAQLGNWSGKGGALGKLFSGAGGGMDILGDVFGKGGMMGMLLGPEVGVATAIIGTVGSTITRVIGGALNLAGKAAGAVVNTVEAIGGAALNAAGKIGKIGLGLAGAAAVGTGMLLKQAMDAGMQKEGFIAKLQTSLKSDTMAEEYYAWGKKFADATPFETPEVIDAIVRLQAYGLEAKHWMPLVGDMASAMGKDVTDAVEAVADAVSGGGLERLKEFGINSQTLLDYGAKGAAGGGVSYQGKAATDALKASLERLMADRFGGGMQKFGSTATASKSNFLSGIKTFFEGVGSGMKTGMKAVYDTGQQVMGMLNSGFAEGLGQKIGTAMAALVEKGKRLWDTGAVKSWADTAWRGVSWVMQLFSENNLKAAGDWLRYAGEMGAWAARAIAAEWPNAIGYLKSGFDHLQYGIAWLYQKLPDIIDWLGNLADTMGKVAAVMLTAGAGAAALVGLWGVSAEMSARAFQVRQWGAEAGHSAFNRAAAMRTAQSNDIGNWTGMPTGTEQERAAKEAARPWWYRPPAQDFTPKPVDLGPLPTMPTSGFAWPNPNYVAPNPFASMAPAPTANAGYTGGIAWTGAGQVPAQYASAEQIAEMRAQTEVLRRVASGVDAWGRRIQPQF